MNQVSGEGSKLILVRRFPDLKKNYFNIGFYDDFETGTFGTKTKKGAKRPLSNFNFKFKVKMIASDPSSTGYLVEVVPEDMHMQEVDFASR